MFYVYEFDHLGTYKMIWKLVQPGKGYETSAQVNDAIRAIARMHDMDFGRYRAVFYSEPKDVEQYVASIYYHTPHGPHK